MATKHNLDNELTNEHFQFCICWTHFNTSMIKYTKTKNETVTDELTGRQPLWQLPLIRSDCVGQQVYDDVWYVRLYQNAMLSHFLFTMNDGLWTMVVTYYHFSLTPIGHKLHSLPCCFLGFTHKCRQSNTIGLTLIYIDNHWAHFPFSHNLDTLINYQDK